MHYLIQRQGELAKVSADSGMGNLSRPAAISAAEGGRIAGRESLFEFWLDVQEDPSANIARYRDKLLTHPTVSACMQLRRENVVGMEMSFVKAKHPQDPAAAEALASYLDEVWQSIPNNRRRFFLDECQNAIIEGGQGHEWIWHKEADGTERPQTCEPVHKSRCRFDRLGNMAILTRTDPVWGQYVQKFSVASPEFEDHVLLSKLPLGKFTYCVYRRGQGTWDKPDQEGWAVFGRGLEVELVPLVIRHLDAWLGQTLWLAQYGRPPRLFYCPPGNDWTSWAQRIARDLMSRQIVVIPFRTSGTTGNQKMFEVEQPSVPSPSFDAFGMNMDRADKYIEKVILMSGGVMDVGSTGGGYSAHESHREQGPDALARRDSATICGTIDEQLVPAMIRYGPEQFRNAPVSDWPRLSATPVREDEPMEVASLYEKCVKFVPLSKSDFYRRTGLNKPKDEEDKLEPADDAFRELLDGGDAAGAEAQKQEAEGPGDEMTGESRKVTPIGHGEDEGNGNGEHLRELRRQRMLK